MTRNHMTIEIETKQDGHVELRKIGKTVMAAPLSLIVLQRGIRKGSVIMYIYIYIYIYTHI